jgi:predicted GNAT family acetyltransferase
VGAALGTALGVGAAVAGVAVEEGAITGNVGAAVGACVDAGPLPAGDGTADAPQAATMQRQTASATAGRTTFGRATVARVAVILSLGAGSRIRDSLPWEERVDVHVTNSAEAFLEHCASTLVEDEALHCVMLGLATELRAGTYRPLSSPVMAWVECERAVTFASMRTPPNSVLLSRVHDADAVAALAERFVREGFDLPGAIGPRPSIEAFGPAWSVASGVAVAPGMAQLAYELREVRRPRPAPGRMREATRADRELLVDWFVAFMVDAFGSAESFDAERRVDRLLDGRGIGLVLWEDGEPVSMSAYSGPTPNGMRIGGVYTPPEFRRRGYASALVADLSKRILDAGRSRCFLFTDASNATSNQIYRAIGYELVGEVAEAKFGGAVAPGRP